MGQDTKTLNMYRQSAIEAGSSPALIIVLFLIMMLVWRIFDLPDPEETYDLIVGFFAEYGLWVVAVGALGEGVAVINLYFPGSAAVLLGVVSSEGDVFRAAMVVFVASLGFIIAAHLNYAIGYYGLHPLLHRFGGRRLLERGERRYRERGVRALAAGYFHPNIGGLIAVAAGAARLQWSKFLAVTTIAIIFWNTLWGVVVYLAARPVREVATSPYLVLVALVIWLSVAVMLAVIRTYLRKRES